RRRARRGPRATPSGTQGAAWLAAYTRRVDRPVNSRPLLVRARSAAVVVLAVLLALTSGGGAHAFDWPRDPALRPVPESVVSTLDAESAMAKKLSKVLKRGGLGPSFSLRVVDVESGRVVDARDDATARIAASNTKLFTA